MWNPVRDGRLQAEYEAAVLANAYREAQEEAEAAGAIGLLKMIGLTAGIVISALIIKKR